MYPILKNLCLAGIFLQLSTTLNAQVSCLTTGWKSASSFVTNDSIGDFDFVSLTNAQSSDDIRSYASTDAVTFSGTTYLLEATDFGFNVPLNATICGVSVEVELRAGGSFVSGIIKDNEIRIIKKGSILGDNKSGPDAWGSSDVYTGYGGEQDTWGLTLLPEVVNMSNFGVAISASLIGSPGEILIAEIDHIRMKVDYKMILPVSLSYFKATKAGNRADLEWKTGQEENYGQIILERSFNNQTWEAIATYELSSNSGKQYRYQDQMTEKGNYSYRLKLVNASGSYNYSNINRVTYEGKIGMSVYPSPAADFITVENIQDPKNVKLFNLLNQEEKFTLEKSGPGIYRIDIRSLKQGSYILKSGNQMSRFIKI